MGRICLPVLAQWIVSHRHSPKCMVAISAWPSQPVSLVHKAFVAVTTFSREGGFAVLALVSERLTMNLRWRRRFEFWKRKSIGSAWKSRTGTSRGFFCSLRPRKAHPRVLESKNPFSDAAALGPTPPFANLCFVFPVTWTLGSIVLWDLPFGSSRPFTQGWSVDPTPGTVASNAPLTAPLPSLSLCEPLPWFVLTSCAVVPVCCCLPVFAFERIDLYLATCFYIWPCLLSGPALPTHRHLCF